MTPLASKIRRQIELTGPVTVAEYMAQCLFDRDQGYYSTREPFGLAGDFTTAPEISQMFGEILAAWWLSARSILNLPDAVLAEAGPGRGTLMNDMLRTISKLEPSPLPQVLMIEASARLVQKQKELLRHHGADIVWTDTFLKLGDRPIGLVANELLDAIPIRQFVKTKGGWIERMVRVNDEGMFAYALGTAVLDPAILPEGHESEPNGQIFEHSSERLAVVGMVSAHLRKHGGFALFVDYGHSQSGFGDTFQAVRNHAPADVFDQAGEADLTAHVDFQAIAREAFSHGVFASEIMEQGRFLIDSGINERAARLSALAPQDKVERINTELERLAGEKNMGRLFKVLALSSEKTDLPPLKF